MPLKLVHVNRHGRKHKPAINQNQAISYHSRNMFTPLDLGDK